MSLQPLIKRTAVGLLVIAAGTAGFLVGRSDAPRGDEMAMVGEAPGGDRPGDILYWRAPMDPTEIYDQPGKSRMGMDLVPVYADERASASGTVSIDPRMAQNMGIRTSHVLRKDFSRQIRTVGEVGYDEERLYLVNTKISGWIERLHVNFVGDEVREGEPLMEIYSPELVSTQEEYLLAVRNVQALDDAAPDFVREDANRLLEAVRTRLAYWDIPDEEISRLEQSGTVRKTVRIKAPATGVVVEKDAIEGAFVEAGSDLFKIANLTQVWVHASFYDNEVPWIRVGQPVEMELSYLPGETYEGRVSYIYPFLREKARDVHVRLIFDNSRNLDLKPGMYANVLLHGRTIPDAVVVPTEAVIRSGQRALAFVVREPGRFEPREVRVGEISGTGNSEIRVLEGLSAGEEVVTSAQFLLDSESRLQEAIQKMLEAPTPDSMGHGMMETMGTGAMEAMQHGTSPDSTGHAGAMREGAHGDARHMP